MNHGEAVAVGTALIAGAAVKLGALTQADCDRIVNVLTALGFDLTPPVEVKRLLKEVGKDKKTKTACCGSSCRSGSATARCGR